MVVLDDIPFEPDVLALRSRLHIREGSRDLEEFEALIRSLKPLIRPKATYRVSYIQGREADRVKVEGVEFASRVLRAKLDSVERVFPYVATCGAEADGAAVPADDLVKRFWLDAIKEDALRQGLDFLRKHLKEKHALKKVASLSPGAGDERLWPIEQQKPLFALLGSGPARIGVRLTESFLMVPTKSVSGILFPTEVDFETCQLCPREGCPQRRARFDEGLMDSFYHDTD